MSDVTQKDVDLAALIIRNSEVSHGSKLIADYRIAAEKAVLDKLRNLPDDVAQIASGKAVEDFVMYIGIVETKWIASALADALETKR